MVAKNLNGTFEYGHAVPRWITPAADQAHWFEPEQCVRPTFGVLEEHLRCNPEDGDIKTMLEERVELRHAVHGVFDDHHVGSGFRIRVGDDATLGEFEDVGDPYPVCVRTLLHLLGEAEQVPCITEEVCASRREDDMTAVADEEARAELVLELADLLGQC